MKLDKHKFVIISVSLNIFFILAAVLFAGFNWNLENSSKVGDTVGGILGPLIGVISIYYLNKAYQEQRNTLIEEKKVNSDQRSAAYYTELLNALRSVSEEFEQINYTRTEFILMRGPEIIETSGKRLFRTYVQFNHNVIQSLHLEFPTRDLDFLRDILSAFQHLAQIEIRKMRLKDLLTEDHFNDVTEQEKIVMNDFGVDVNTIFFNITYFVDLAGTEGFTPVQRESLNTVYQFIKKYQEIAGIFIDGNILTPMLTQNVPEIQEPWNENQQGIFTETQVDMELRSSINFNLNFPGRFE